MKAWTFLLLTGLLLLVGSKSNAGYYRYPLEGFHKACADGSSADLAILTGYGGMYLTGNGNPMNAYPMDMFTGDWSPLLGGGSLCWTRQMSAGTQKSLINSYQKYCIDSQNHYCF